MVIFLSKVGLASNITPFELSVTWNIFERSSNVSAFASNATSGTWSSFLSQLLPSILIRLPLVSSSGCIPRVSLVVAVSAFPQSATFSYNSMYVRFEFQYTFNFWVITSFNYSLKKTHHLDFIAGRPGGNITAQFE